MSDLLAKELAALVDRLRRWTPTRWSAAAGPWGSRADLVHHLAQALADAAAAAEGAGAGEATGAGEAAGAAGPRRELPRLGNVLLGADQLAVTGDDLVRATATPAVLEEVVAHLLLHRYDLLGEEPPASLGGPAVLERGRAACEAGGGVLRA